MENQGVDEKTVFKQMMLRLHTVCLDPMVGCCEYGNEALGSVKGYKHLNQVNNHSLLNSILLM